MDLNYLLGRHQQSLYRSQTAACTEARIAHGAMATGYVARIRALQDRMGAHARLVDAR